MISQTAQTCLEAIFSSQTISTLIQTILEAKEKELENQQGHNIL